MAMLERRLILIFFFCISLSYPAFGISIRPPILEIDFEPGAEHVLEFSAWGAEDIELYVREDFSEYATLSHERLKDRGTFTVTLKFPENAKKPGRNKMVVGALEMVSASHMVGGVAAIQAPVIINVPYEGTYIQSGFKIADMNINETKEISLWVKNAGSNHIGSVFAEIEIMEQPKNITKRRIVTEEMPLLMRSEVRFPVLFNSTGLSAGNYFARAKIYYDGILAEHQDEFIIGDLKMEIVKYPNKIRNGTINEFPVVIRSGWNGMIKQVYAEISVLRNGLLMAPLAITPSINFGSFEEKELLGYVDTDDVPPGKYDLAIDVFYEGQSTHADDVIFVVPEEKAEEKRELLSLESANIGLFGVVVLLIIFDLLWIFVFRKRHGQEKPQNRKVSGKGKAR